MTPLALIILVAALIVPAIHDRGRLVEVARSATRLNIAAVVLLIGFTAVRHGPLWGLYALVVYPHVWLSTMLVFDWVDARRDRRRRRSSS